MINNRHFGCRMIPILAFLFAIGGTRLVADTNVNEELQWIGDGVEDSYLISRSGKSSKRSTAKKRGKKAVKRIKRTNRTRGPKRTVAHSSFAGTSSQYIPWTTPGINVSSPAGYGANWGNVFAGVGFQARTRFTRVADGALAAGFGVGDSQKYVGFESSVSVFSVTGSDSFERGGFSFKLHRALPYNFGVAVGRENAITWGGSDAGRSWYGSVSKVFFLKRVPSEWFSALTLTAGVGNGRFRSETDVNAGNDTINPFGSLAVRIQEPVSFIVDWTGQDLNLGLSITPLRKYGLYINPAIADVTESAGDGARFIIGIGYGYDFS